jgi:formimidoylglutamate deiminase
VLDPLAPGLLGVPDEHRLDALVFSVDAPAFSEVWVAGRRRVQAGRAPDAEAVASRFAAAMSALWSGGRETTAAP